MKHRFYYLLFFFLFCSFLGYGQIKIGANPSSINSNSNFQVEATNGRQLTVTRDNGRLGIGTLTPTFTVDIPVGPLRIGPDEPNPALLLHSSSNGPGGGGRVEFQEPFSSFAYSIQHLSEDAIDGLYFRRLAPTTPNIRDLLVIRESGNVGIGISNPTKQLHIAPGSGILVGNPSSGNLFTGSASLGGVEIIGEADGGYISAQRNGDSPSLHVTKRVGGAGDALMEFSLNGANRGYVRLTSGGVSYLTTSDKRLKTNISSTAYGLKDLVKLNVVDYHYRSDVNSPKSTGFLAQELYDIYPVAVKKGGEDPIKNPWQVEYALLTPLLVKSIQELNEEILQLKKENQQLKATNSHLVEVSKQVETIQSQIKLINSLLNTENKKNAE